MTNKPSIRKLIKKSAFIFSLSFIFLLASCEGFFTNNDLDVKIKDAIAYANAPTSSFFISADASAGTITPVGKISYKPTDYQNIKFKIKPEYEFIRWNFRYEEIQSGEKYTREITNPNWYKDYIDIVNEEISEPSTTGEITYTLQIQFKKPEENMLIEPVCALKPVLKSWSGQLGEIQSRNGSLSFVFNTKLDLDKSIYFSDAELNECAVDEETGEVVQITPLFNGQNPARVYGYVKNRETYFKNIEIKYKNRSINSSYKDFRWNNETNTLIIASDPTHSFDIIGDFADIEVLFKEGIKSEAQASMNESKAFINVNKYSDELSVITVVTNTAKNPETVSPVTQALHLQEQKSVSFTESDGIQFLYWEVTSNSAYPESKDKVYTEADEENPRKLNYWGMQKIDSTEEVTISAVYEFRPKILSYTPNAQTVAPKDSDIQINFDEEINLKSFKAGYKITCGGDPVNDYFDEPVLSADKKSVIIAAKLDKRLLIDSNKQVTVTVPATVYYEKTESDGKTYQITLGQEKQLAYTINPETKDKAHIQFNVDKNQVTVDNFNTNEIKHWSVGDTKTIVCNEKAGYQFLGWIDDTDDAIEITKVNNSTYTFKVLKPCGEENTPKNIDVIVKERLRVNRISPAMDENGVEKDRAIKIYFNHAPNIEHCRQMIAINCSNLGNVKDCFPIDGWSYKTDDNTGETYLNIKPDPSNRINISALSTVTVSFSSNLYYSDDSNLIYYGGDGYSYSYKIKNEALTKATVEFFATTGQGTIKKGSDGRYSIDKKIQIEFEPDNDFEFLYWKTTPEEILNFADEDDKFLLKTNVIVAAGNGEDEKVTVTPVCAPKLKVSKIELRTTTASTTTDITNNNSTPYPKDSDIIVTFNTNEMVNYTSSLSRFVSIYFNGKDVLGNYSFTSPAPNAMSFTALSIPNYRLQLEPSPSENKVSLTFAGGYLYYIYTDDIITKNIYLTDDYTKSFIVNSNTKEKTKIEFQTINGSLTVNDSSGTVRTLSSTGTVSYNGSYNLDNVIPVNYIPASGYKFLGWDINPLYSSYIEIKDITNPNTTITVKNAYTSENIIIKPKVAEYLVIQDSIKIDDVTFVASNSYAKDSVIKLTLNKNLSITDNTISSYVTVKHGNQDVTNYFEIEYQNHQNNNPKELWISQKNSNRLQIDSVEEFLITIDKNLYYTDANSNPVGLQEDYDLRILLNSQTIQKAKVMVTNYSTYGSITNAAGTSFTPTENNKYNLDETITLNFTANENYEFLYWNLETKNSNGSDVTLTNLQLPSSWNTARKNSSLTVVVKGAKQDEITTIKPVCVAKLAISSVYVNGADLSSYPSGYPAGTPYPKDSTIVITFNEAPVSTLILNNYITLKCDGIPLPDNFSASLNGKNLTLTADQNKRLDINTTKNLEIIVSKDIYYITSNSISGTKNVFMKEDVTKSIPINFETVDTANVKVDYYTTGTQNGTLSITDATSPISVGTAVDMSKDRTFKLSYTPASGYEFIEWKVFGNTTVTKNIGFQSESTDNPISVKILNSKKDTDEEDNTVTIKPYSVAKPKIIKYTINAQDPVACNTSNPTPSGTYSKDSSYTLEFNTNNVCSSMQNYSLAGYVTIKYDTYKVNDYFDLFWEDNKLKIEAKSDKRLNNISASKKLTITVDKGMFYTEASSTIKMDEDFVLSVVLNTETERKTSVKVTPNTNRCTLTKIDSNVSTVISSEKTYSLTMDYSFALSCEPLPGWDFAYWEIRGDTLGSKSNITISDLESKYINVKVVDSQGYSVQIVPQFIERLQVTKIKINSGEFDPLHVYTKDPKISIFFNKNLPEEAQNYIHLYYLGEEVTGTYFELKHMKDQQTGNYNNEFLFDPISKKFINATEGSSLVVTVDKEIYACYRVPINGNNKDKTVSMEDDYTNTIKIDYKSKNKFKLSSSPSPIKGGTVKQTPYYPDGVYYLGQPITFEFEENEDYEFLSWFHTNDTEYLQYEITKGSFQEKSVTLNFIKSSSDSQEYRVFGDTKLLPKLVSISPTPSPYDSSGNLINTGSIPCNTSIVLTFNDKLRADTTRTSAVDNSAYDHANKPRQGFRVYTIIDGAEIEIGGSGYHSVNGDSGTSDPIRHVDSDVITIKPGYGTLNTLLSQNHLSELRIYVEILPCTVNGRQHLRTVGVYNAQGRLLSGDEDIVGYHTTLNDYIRNNTFSFVVNTSVVPTTPQVIEEYFWMDDSAYEQHESKKKYLTPGRKINCEDEIKESPELCSRTGILRYKFLLNNWGNWYDTPSQSSGELDIEATRIGTFKKNANGNWEYESKTEMLWRITKPYRASFPSDGDEIDLSGFGYVKGDVILVRFTIYDINYGYIKREFYVYYDQGFPLDQHEYWD